MSPVASPLTAYSDGDEGADYEQRRLRQASIALAGGCRPTGACARVWSSMEVPWHASAHDAPVLTVHSKDEFVPAYQSELLKEQLNQVGVPMNIRWCRGSTTAGALPGAGGRAGHRGVGRGQARGAHPIEGEHPPAGEHEEHSGCCRLVQLLAEDMKG